MRDCEGPSRRRWPGGLPRFLIDWTMTLNDIWIGMCYLYLPRLENPQNLCRDVCAQSSSRGVRRRSTSCHAKWFPAASRDFACGSRVQPCRRCGVVNSRRPTGCSAQWSLMSCPPTSSSINHPVDRRGGSTVVVPDGWSGPPYTAANKPSKSLYTSLEVGGIALPNMLS